MKAALNLMVLATVPILEGAAGQRRWKMAVISTAAFLVATAGVAAVAWKLWK